MPYKNPVKARESNNRYWKRNYKKRLKLNRIGKMALREHPIAMKCSIKRCYIKGERHHDDYSKPKEIIWLCKKHHEELHHKTFKMCGEKDCTRKHWCKGFCRKHYKRMRREMGIPKSKQ